MARRHPRQSTEIITDDALVDVVLRGFDAGIRLGEMVAQDMVAVRLTPPFRAIMVASPSYVSARGQPAAVADLRNTTVSAFVCWFRVRSTTGSCWIAERRCGAPWRGLYAYPTYARELALASLRVAYVFEPLVRSDLTGGRLVELFPDAAITEPGLFLYFPRRAAEARKLRAA